MLIQRPKDLGSIKEVGIVKNLLRVETKERQVENKRDPVAVDEEEECQEAVHRGFWDDVSV
jgi:hypothetical protein